MGWKMKESQMYEIFSFCYPSLVIVLLRFLDLLFYYPSSNSIQSFRDSPNRGAALFLTLEKQLQWLRKL